MLWIPVPGSFYQYPVDRKDAVYLPPSWKKESVSSSSLVHNFPRAMKKRTACFLSLINSSNSLRGGHVPSAFRPVRQPVILYHVPDISMEVGGYSRDPRLILWEETKFRSIWGMCATGISVAFRGTTTHPHRYICFQLTSPPHTHSPGCSSIVSLFSALANNFCTCRMKLSAQLRPSHPVQPHICLMCKQLRGKYQPAISTPQVCWVIQGSYKVFHHTALPRSLPLNWTAYIQVEEALTAVFSSYEELQRGATLQENDDQTEHVKPANLSQVRFPWPYRVPSLLWKGYWGKQDADFVRELTLKNIQRNRRATKYHQVQEFKKNIATIGAS